MLNCQADIDNANNLLRDLRWGNTKKRKDGLNPCDHDLTFDCQVNENDRLESIQLKYADGREISLENYECRFKYAVQIAVAVKKIAEGEKPDKQLIPIIRSLAKDRKYYLETIKLITEIISLSKKSLDVLEKEQAKSNVGVVEVVAYGGGPQEEGGGKKELKSAR